MLEYVARRLLLAVPLVFCIVTAVFVLVELSPGDAASKYLHPDMAPEVRDAIVVKMGLDRPIHVRYGRMLVNLATFDFGRSLVQDRPVFDIMAEALPNTLVLSTITLLVLFPVGIAMGTVQAIRQNTGIDVGASVASLALYSMPAFWVAMMLQLLLGHYWSGWTADLVRDGVLSPSTRALLTLPVSGMKDAVMHDMMSTGEQWLDRIKHLLLPGIAMGLASAASTARYMRSSMLGIIRQDFVRTARAKGLTEGQVLLRHGVRNALLPIVTLIGLTLPYLFSGSVLVEYVFAWPGMGRVIHAAILTQDVPLLVACFYVFTLVVVSANLVADLVYAWVDPRIRFA